MAIDMAIWHLEGEQVQAVSLGGMDLEERLETVIDKTPSIIDSNLMIIGRQVSIVEGKIDLLAIDAGGNLTAIELKRNKTPRDVVAQALDYGSAVRQLTSEQIARIFIDYQQRFRTGEAKTIDMAFRDRFHTPLKEINSSHRLLIVAAEVDPATERIVQYLQEEYEADINVVFFRAFRDGDDQFLARSWMSEPQDSSTSPARAEWKGDYYVNFGLRPDDDPHHRSWSDAREYGFVSAGGGERYARALSLLQPGNRVWVTVPGRGYVGVGRVTTPAAHFNEFNVLVNGVPTRITDDAVKLEATNAFEEEYAQHFVGIKWEKTVDLDKAVWERGFFAKQHIVMKPRHTTWDFTLERLKNLWGVE